MWGEGESSGGERLLLVERRWGGTVLRGERGMPIFKKVGLYVTPLFEGGKRGDH